MDECGTCVHCDEGLGTRCKLRWQFRALLLRHLIADNSRASYSAPRDGTQLECVASRIECGACGRCFGHFGGQCDRLAPTVSCGPRRSRIRLLARLSARISPAVYAESTCQRVGGARSVRHPLVAQAPSASRCCPSLDRRRQSQQDASPLRPISRGRQLHIFIRLAFPCRCSLRFIGRQPELCRAKGKPSLEIRNMFFLRIDYFSPPFQSSLDRVICFDTLIRGESHDAALLDCIRRTLKSEGQAVVDFHNWWHNPVRRLGLLPQNFGENRSYRRPSAAHLLRKTGIVDFDFFPFHQEFDHGAKLHNLLAFALPPTRILYRFTGKAAPSNARQGNHNSKLEADSCG